MTNNNTESYDNTERRNNTMETKQTYTITTNAEYNSTEVSFDSKPSEAIRDALKAMRFRWHNIKKVWYGYKDAKEVRSAIEQAEQGKAEQGDQATLGTKRSEAAKPEPKKNKYGVKVGDFFRATWGYEQTNNNFFQVVELVGECSVRVREVEPEILESTGISWASEDRIVNTKNTGKLLPPSEHFSFINDQERGDLKRLQCYADSECSIPYFKVASYAIARFCPEDKTKVYESWYA